MATYIEVRPDDDEESDTAQPSTSSCSGTSKVKRSDSCNNKSGSEPNADAGNSRRDPELGESAREHQSSSRPSSRKSRHRRGHSNHSNHSSRHNNHVPTPSPNPEPEYKDPERGTDGEVREYDFCMKSQMADGHIIDLRGREVLFAIGVFFFLSVSIGLIVVLASNKVKELNQAKLENGKTATCYTKECMSRASAMLAMMDRTAQPCTDFWRYACGGWLDGAEIPPREDSWGVSKELRRRIAGDILKLLQSDVSRNTTSSAERKMKVVYASCMDLDAIDEFGTRGVLDIMDRFGGWAIFGDWNMKMKPGLWNFQSFLKELHHQYYIQVFFTMFVHPDDKGGGNLLQFDQSVFPYPDVFDPFRSSPEFTDAYKEYMREIVQLFKPLPNDLDHFVNATFDFEEQLAQIHEFVFGASEGNPQDNYNSITVAELQVLCPEVNWLDFIQATYPQVGSRSTILVTDLEYFKKLSEFLRSASDRSLNYYMMWRLVDDFAPNLPLPFRKAHQKFMKTYQGKPTKQTRQDYCVDMMGKMFGFELGSSFVHKYFPPSEKYAVQDMIGHIRDSLHDALASSSWLVNTTKTEAMKKIKAMDFQVGYPDFIKEQDKVDEYYENFHVNQGDSFFHHLISYYKHEKELSKKNLAGTLHDPEWLMHPYEVNAYTNPFDNSILIPAGVLQRPHYDNALPKYINYGSMGSVIGHEMMHAFDGTGAMFDSEGAMRLWWDSESQAEFNARLKCVADFYSGFTYRGHKINGTTTQNENLADIEGLKLAYKAYHMKMENAPEEVYMPGLKLTNDQIFFLSFAQNYCKIRRPEMIERYLANSEHMIEELRVKGTLAQVPAFAKVFKCKAKTTMNPQRRCSLWL